MHAIGCGCRCPGCLEWCVFFLVNCSEIHAILGEICTTLRNVGAGGQKPCKIP